MNNNSSSSFATVVFVVFILIGGGFLLYHCKVISAENAQLRDDLAACQAETGAVIAENTSLATTIQTLTAEKNTLLTENANQAAKIYELETLVMALQAGVTAQGSEELQAELEALRMENNALNQRINSMLGGEETNRSADQAPQSPLMADIPGLWMAAALLAVIGLGMFLVGILFLLYKQLRPK